MVIREETEDNYDKFTIVDVLLNRQIGSTYNEINFINEIVKKLDILKESKMSKPRKGERIESIIEEYYDKHGASCHFFLQKRLNEYVTMKYTFELGVIQEILGKQMRKCGCSVNN